MGGGGSFSFLSKPAGAGAGAGASKGGFAPMASKPAASAGDGEGDGEEGGEGGEDDGAGPVEGERPSDNVPKAVEADKLLLPTETIAYEVRAAAKKWGIREVTDPTTKECKQERAWLSLDAGTLRVIRDASTGKSRIVFSPPNATRLLLNSLISEHAKIADVAGAEGTAGGKSRLDCTVVTEAGLTRFIFTVKTPAQAQELKAAFNAGKQQQQQAK
jgi:hypothetical protein